MNRVQTFYFRWWRIAVFLLSFALIAYLLYFHHLSSLLPGYSDSELKSFSNSASWQAISKNPVNAPFKATVWLLTRVVHDGIEMNRLVSASYGIVAVLVFFAITKSWYSFRVAFLGTLLFATSAGFLHSARLGTGQVLQMSVLALMGALLWFRRLHHRRVPAGYGLALLLGLLLYVPGMIWYELLGIVLLHSGLRRQLGRMSNLHVAGWAIIFLATIVPVVLAAISNPQILVTLSGLPPSLHGLSAIGSNALNAVLSIGIRSNGNPQVWVGHAPLLDIVELTLAAIGAYFYVRRFRSTRSIFVIGSTVLSLLLVSFGGSVGFTSLVPLVYLFVVSGLHHLLGQWLTVFPRNPIAKFTGVAIICVMLGFSVLYQTRSYFVAWPHNSVTRQTFDNRAP